VLDIEVRGEEIVLRGRLDAAEAGKADRAFGAIAGSATVDAAGLEYVSSAGLSVFVKTQLRLKADGHTLRIVNAVPRVRAVFHYANLASILTME